MESKTENEIRFHTREKILPPFEGHRKDPCPVLRITSNGPEYHIYCSRGQNGTVGQRGVKAPEVWTIGHYKSSDLSHWERCPDAVLDLKGDHIAAPSVVYHQGCFQMVVQQDFLKDGGHIYQLESEDGHHFKNARSLLSPCPEIGELGLYDPHLMTNCEALGLPANSVLTYSGGQMFERSHNFAAEVDLKIAVLDKGVWRCQGTLISKKNIPRHNQAGVSHDFEWDPEGSQLFHTGEHLCGVAVRFKDKFLNGLDAPPIPRGERQEVFFMTSLTNTLEGPFIDIDIDLFMGKLEYGHAAAMIDRSHDSLRVFTQVRHTLEVCDNGAYCISTPWDVADATCSLMEFNQYVSRIKHCLTETSSPVTSRHFLNIV